MHAPLNGVGATPVINILTIPSGRIHPNIIAYQLVAICCVICQLFHELSPFSCHHPLIHVYINTTYDCSTAPTPHYWTLLRPIDWLFLSYYHPIQCKNTCQRQQSHCFSAPERPTTTASPQNQSAESADEVDCVAARSRSEWRPFIDEWGRRTFVMVPCCFLPLFFDPH